MTRSIQANNLFKYGLPALVYLACFLIARSNMYRSGASHLDLAILGDLMVTAPLLYWLTARQSKISFYVMIRWMVVGVLFAGMIIRAGDHTPLHFIKTWVMPFVELMVITLVVLRFRQAKKAARSTAGEGADFLNHSRKITGGLLGNEKLGDLLGSEIAVGYYIFSRKKEVDQINSFSNYRESGIVLILGVFLSLMMVETVAMHFLLQIWSTMAAWILTGLSVYTCLQLYAHTRSLRSRPTVLLQDGIWIKYGFAGEVFIPYDIISSFGKEKKFVPGEDSVRLSFFKALESTNMVVVLQEWVTVTRFFGIKQKAKKIYFHIDDADAFVRSLQNKIDN